MITDFNNLQGKMRHVNGKLYIITSSYVDWMYYQLNISMLPLNNKEELYKNEKFNIPHGKEKEFMDALVFNKPIGKLL